MEYDLRLLFLLLYFEMKRHHFPGSQKHKKSQIQVLITIVGESTFCKRAVKNEALFAKQTTQ